MEQNFKYKQYNLSALLFFLLFFLLLLSAIFYLGRSGNPQAERKSLAAVGAGTEIPRAVYQQMSKNEVAAQGMLYTDMESALKRNTDMVHKYFHETCHRHDHKFETAARSRYGWVFARLVVARVIR